MNVGGKKEHSRTLHDWGARVLGLHLLAIHLDVCDVVLKDGGDVDLWELILAEDNEQAGLPTGTVAHDHELLSDCGHD